MPVIPPELLGAGITGGAGIVGTALSAVTQGSVNRQQQSWAYNMYQRQRQDALMDWNMNNLYNSPQAQMRRLKAAGLNPNLVYGHGAPGNASQGVRASSPGSISPRAPSYDLGGVAGQAMNSYFQSQQIQMQRANLEKSWEMMDERKRLMQAQAIKTLSDVDKNKLGIRSGEFDLAQRQGLANYVLEQAKLKNQLMASSIHKVNMEISKIFEDTVFTKDQNTRNWIMQGQNIKESAERILSSQKGRELSDSQIQNLQHNILNLEKDGTLKAIEIGLNQLGINKNDPWYFRVLGNIVGDSEQAKKSIEELGVIGFIKQLRATDRQRKGYKEWVPLTPDNAPDNFKR